MPSLGMSSASQVSITMTMNNFNHLLLSNKPRSQRCMYHNQWEATTFSPCFVSFCLTGWTISLLDRHSMNRKKNDPIHTNSYKLQQCMPCVCSILVLLIQFMLMLILIASLYVHWAMHFWDFKSHHMVNYYFSLRAYFLFTFN